MTQQSNVEERFVDNIKQIISAPFINPPLDKIPASELKVIWDWQKIQILNLIQLAEQKVMEEVIEKIEEYADDQEDQDIKLAIIGCKSLINK